jgi:D-glycero-D-manno-heptose 1,7-bisphosphate phosphatase
MTHSRQLVVLVGGKGTRLGALSKSTPKPLMPVSEDKVFLDYFLESAVRQGFKEILLIAGHLGEQVSARYNHLKIHGADVSVLIEPEPKGTGGAFVFAMDHLAETFVAANGDTLFDINIRAVDAELHRSKDLLAVLALREIEDAGRYGSVETNANGDITEFKEKNEMALGKRGLINGGIYAFRRSAIEKLKSLPASVETDLFPVLAQEGRIAGVKSSGYFLDIGLPETLATARAELPLRQRPAVFFDRDGVLNKDKAYVHKIDDWEWVDGAKDAIKLANDKGFAVIVVTNQAGIGRGYYQEADVWRLHQTIQEELHENGAFIDAFYYSPHHPEAIHSKYQIISPLCRKPNSAMILRAARQHNLDLKRSVLIGDQLTDLAAAQSAGVNGHLFKGGNLLEVLSPLLLE